jgi:CO/xanthine dehydrogenase FAD-binding subunit
VSDYVRPASLEEAYTARAEHPDWLVLAGGTDVMVGALHRPPPAGVIDVFGLDGLGGIEAREDWIRIGAGTTYAELIAHDVVRQELPALQLCCREIGALQIQARGTVGGNMGTSSPVGDTLPMWLALDAEVELGSSQGLRRVPYHTFCTGYRQTVMRPDELIVAIEVPRPGEGLHQFWRKVGTRRAQAISKVMVAAAARLADGAISHVRLAMGAVADRPVRLVETEALLLGQAPTAELAERVREHVRTEIVPISDVRSTADYRLTAAANLAARFVTTLGGAS